jgi:hypothetical protein
MGQTNAKKPVFEKRIFWDVNFEELNYDLKASFVIERVFEMWKISGNAEDTMGTVRFTMFF